MAPINVSLTGGTKAPGGKAPAVPRYYNRASGKMETAAAMKGYRAPNQRVSAAARAMGAPRAHAAAPPARPAPQPKSTPYVHALGTTFGFPAAKGRGIEGLINAAQGAERGTVLAPYQQKADEIGNTERTVSNRVGAFNQQAQNALSGIAGQQEASAKTFENQAAETALQSQKGIETAGQNAITSSGGYLDPQLRAQIAASQAEITGLGQAATTRANELGNAQNAYMRQLQAAGVQRGQEGQKELTNIYGAERARNTAAENQALGRLEAKAKAERITVPKELRSQEILENKLRQSGELGAGKLAQGAAKIAQGAARLRQTGAATTSKIAHEASDTEYKRKEAGWKIAGLEGAERQRAINNQINKGKLKVSELSQADKSAYDRWKMTQGGGTKGGIKYSTANALKYRSDYGKVESKGRSAGLNANSSQAEFNKVRGELAKEGIDAHLISAAMNMIKYGRTGPNDKAYAKSIGAEK